MVKNENKISHGTCQQFEQAIYELFEIIVQYLVVSEFLMELILSNENILKNIIL